MGSAVKLRDDYSAGELRRLARISRDTRQGSRLLSIAAVLEGMSRADAARIGGMDRQTLRDWVHRFNATGPDGLVDQWSPGPTPRLSPEQQSELVVIVETGPDRAVDGVRQQSALVVGRVVEAGGCCLRVVTVNLRSRALVDVIPARRVGDAEPLHQAVFHHPAFLKGAGIVGGVVRHGRARADVDAVALGRVAFVDIVAETFRRLAVALHAGQRRSLRRARIAEVVEQPLNAAGLFLLGAGVGPA